MLRWLLILVLLGPVTALALDESDRLAAWNRIQAQGLRQFMTSVQTDPESFVIGLMAAASPDIRARVQRLVGPTEGTASWYTGLLPEARTRLALDLAQVDDPVSLLMHGAELDRDWELGLRRLTGWVLAAYRQGTTLGGVLQDQGVVERYRRRFLVSLSGTEYARAAAGRWCDWSGVAFSVNDVGFATADRWTLADFQLTPVEEDGSPSLLVTFRDPDPGRFFLRYQPDQDRLYRAFRWDGRWFPMSRCPQRQWMAVSPTR